MWEYGKERGFDWYSAITSVTEYRPETKTMFMYSATAGMSGTNPIVSVLDEVKDGTQDVMLELKVHSNRAGMLGYRALIIDPEQMFKKIKRESKSKTGGSQLPPEWLKRIVVA